MVGEAREPEDETGPLDGVSVLDLSQVLVGPFCTMQLGDLGADVVKVERPGVGDQTRSWRPPSFGTESAYYVSVNRNKRSLTVNLKTDEGREIVRELAAKVDVFVENFRVGQLEEWGLGYDELSSANPGIVYCSLSGYGEWGPDRDRAAYDLIIQAEGGMMGITGQGGGDPVRVGVAIADIGAGMYATQAILSALLERELGSGSGQKIDVSLLDGQVAWMTYMASNYFATGETPDRMGSKHPTIAPYQAFETTDGHVVVAVPSPTIWPAFCEAIEREDLLEDERFETNEMRVRNREALDSLIAEEMSGYSTQEALALFADHGVPASTVYDMEEVFDNPQVRARGMYRTVEHPTAGDLEMAGSPMHFSRTPTSIRRHPPQLGEHNAEILQELGYDERAIERLEDDDVV